MKWSCASVKSSMAGTGIDPANSGRYADAGWPVAHHRVCRTYRGVYRNIMDVDSDRAGSDGKSVDVGRSLRRTSKRFLLDRMRDHGVDAGAARICARVAHASRVAGNCAS